MTKEHPITPPPELIEDWIEITKPLPQRPPNPNELATLAARWGADQELEACISAILSHPGFEQPELFVEVLRTARRPKPPSLKEQALQALYRFDDTEGHKGLTPEQIAEDFVLIRRALESLPS